MGWNPGPLLILLMVLTACAASAQTAPVPEEAPQTSLILSRSHPPRYTPGETVDVVITIEGWGIEEVRALGLRETVPADWELVSVQAFGETAPHIYPGPGARPPFEFVWISPPQLPCAFSYTVMVPGNSRREKEFSGELLYHLNAGPLQTAPTVTLIAGPDAEAPEITLRGDNPMEVQEGDSWVEPGYTALDYDDQDITGQVTVGGTVDTATPGTYTLEYRVTSPSTQISASVSRTVHVSAAPEQDSKDAGLGQALPIRHDLDSPQPVSPRTRHSWKPPESNRQSGTTPAHQPRQAFPDLSAYQPQPVERPDAPATTKPEHADRKESAEHTGEEALRTEDRDHGVVSGLTSEAGRDATREIEGGDGKAGASMGGKWKRLSWIAGITALIVLFAGILLVRHVVYGLSGFRNRRGRP